MRQHSSMTTQTAVEYYQQRVPSQLLRPLHLVNHLMTRRHTERHTRHGMLAQLIKLGRLTPTGLLPQSSKVSQRHMPTTKVSMLQDHCQFDKLFHHDRLAVCIWTQLTVIHSKVRGPQSCPAKRIRQWERAPQNGYLYSHDWRGHSYYNPSSVQIRELQAFA